MTWTSGCRRPTFLEYWEPHARSALLEVSRRAHHARGETLLSQGAAPRDVLVLMSGTAKVTVASAEGDQVMLDLRNRGDLLGELSGMDGTPYSASAVALTCCETLAIQREDFVGLIAEHPTAMKALNGVLAAKARESTDHQIEVSTMDAFGRVCRRIVLLCQLFGTKVNDTWAVSSPLSQQDLAQWLGVSRDAVVKALGTARRLGWIQTARGSFVITDIANLCRVGRLPLLGRSELETGLSSLARRELADAIAR